MWGGINKRRFPRANYKCLITISKKGMERYFLTHTQNIGVGGICVVLDEDLGIFSEVEIELVLKDNDSPIKSKASIAWVVKSQTIKNNLPVIKFDTGIEFVNLKESDRKRIEKIVEDIIKNRTKEDKGEVKA